jgi:acetoin:2,6-dichlorophenolindophenol oxidoreductase subunit beta
VRSTPISEAGFLGAGIGAALTGMRPVIDIQCSTFLYSAMDQIVSQAAKSRYMFGGQSRIPLLIRAPVMYGFSSAAHHSDRPWAMFAQVPGLTVLVPSTPYDVKGLVRSALRAAKPVLCLEELVLSGQVGDVPDTDYTVPIGVADVKRTGSDVTIVALGVCVQHSLAAAEALANEGVSVEVVDVRTVSPLDRNTIVTSVAKTGRLIVVDPAPMTCGLAGEIAATVAERAFDHLKAPIVRVVAPDIPVPFSPSLEKLLYPTVEKIIDAVKSLRLRKGRVALATATAQA